VISILVEGSLVFIIVKGGREGRKKRVQGFYIILLYAPEGSKRHPHWSKREEEEAGHKPQMPSQLSIGKPHHPQGESAPELCQPDCLV
jgi:hypothetical protein